MSTAERVCWVLVVTALAVTALPFAAPDLMEPLGDAQFALVFAAAIVGPSAFVCAFFFRSRNRVRSRLLAGRDLLIRWTYSEDEWRAFAGGETRRQAAEKRTLLWITAVLMLLIGGAFVAYDPRTGVAILLVLLITWVLCWMAARASLRAYQKNESARTAEARISAEGLLLGADFHVWRGWGARLERCALYEGPPRQLGLVYSMPARHGRTETNVRVPIPAGREADAVALVRRLSPAEPLVPVA